MQFAVSAASPSDAESAAWVNTRLAFYEFQAGRVGEAEQRCALALSLQNNYPLTLLLKGKMLLAQSRFGEAVDALQNGVKLNPLPEYQWTLAEALHGKVVEPDPELGLIKFTIKRWQRGYFETKF